MKKLSLFLSLCLVAVMLASCSLFSTYKTTKDIISKNEIEEDKEGTDIVEESETETVTLTLYFPDNDALYLHPEMRQVEVEKGKSLAPIVLEELFKGPESDNLSPSLDGEDLVLSATVEDGLCTVDFAGDFALLNSGGSTRESFAIGSIVNSLCEIDGIEEVKINIDGNKNAEFGGHFTLDATFLPQPDLIAKQ